MNKTIFGLGVICAATLCLATSGHNQTQAATTPDHTATVNYVKGYGITT